MSRLKLQRFRVKQPPPEVLETYVRTYDSSALYHRRDEQPPLTPESLFGRACPLVLDLGCGRGEFVVPQAQQRPDLGFVGFDWHWKSIWAGVNKAHMARLDNVRFVRADFRRALCLIPPGAAAEIYLMFPPPVMQYKQRSLDVVIEPVLHTVHRVLADGGTFTFVTDSGPYFDAKKTLIDSTGLFDIAAESQSFEGGVTWFQRFWEGFDIQSRRLECRKRAIPGVR